MRIERKSQTSSGVAEIKADVERACSPGVDGRVCGPHCAAKCPSCGSMACQCMCSQACENLSQMLSSEPDTFPIEDAIAPLVFELKRTGLFTPCWSCEGHLNPAGQLWKLPQVWFYCSSTVHLRVLSDLLKSLELKKLLNTRWTVSVTHSDVDNLDTTFAVYPELPERAAPTLVSLQADARAIARAMQHDFAAAARKLKAGVGA